MTSTTVFTKIAETKTHHVVQGLGTDTIFCQRASILGVRVAAPVASQMLVVSQKGGTFWALPMQNDTKTGAHLVAANTMELGHPNNSARIVLDDSVKIQGKTSVEGPLQVKGDITFIGPNNQTYSLTQLIIILNAHVHTSTSPSNPTSPPLTAIVGT